MDGPKIQAKLSRTHSSILRSSPTVGSPFESLSSVREFALDQETEDLEEQKPHSRHCTPHVRASASRFALALSVLLLSVYTFVLLLIWDDISTSEDLLLSLIFVAGLLFFVFKNKVLIIRTFVFCKNFFDEHGKRLGLSRFTSKTHSKSVQWFIGESNTYSIEREQQNISFKKIVREGVEFYSNGDFYEGEFHKGRCNGSGVYNYIVNGRYEGDWVDGKYDGYGIESWARGSRYKGQYRQGLRHGYGVYKFYTGDTYAGEWCNGQSHGIGVQTCGDGSCYSGEFKCGVKHGLGCYNFRNGDTYAGEYFGDRIHGFGVYHFGNGHCYEGSWHEGRKQGYGMYTFRNIETRCGEWDGGKLKTPVFPPTGSVLKSVQAARKIAENAMHLRQVEEKVYKALTAADRAATAARVAAVKAVQNRIHDKFCNTNI